MDIDKLHDSLLEPYNDVEIVKSIKALNSIFINRPDNFEDYSHNRALVSAYCAYYMPTNIKKLDFIISQLGALPFKDKKNIDVIDFGCGTGTYSFGLSRYFTDQQNVAYTFMDKSKDMLEQALKVKDALYPDMNAKFVTDFQPYDKEKYRIAIFGNVINETGPAAYLKIFKKLNPDLVIIIEPGTMDSFVKISQVRRFMIKKEFHLLYPCPSPMKCPVEKIDDEWCHQVLRTSLELPLERLGQLSGLDRKNMPFTGHVYSKEASGVQQWDQIFRLKKNSKHAFMWQLCKGSSTNKIIDVEVLKRGLEKSEIKSLEKICAGQFVKTEPVKELNDNTLRITAKIVSDYIPHISN
ncbi:MAG: methyltransferase domain-containing protein [Deltaproteobacteria bacterium]|nr:methyltransferase domain-containing protein [Deltaproteobacteria bacterium]